MKHLPIRTLLAAASLASAFLAPATLAAQAEIVTATQYFAEVADRYSQINDYEAKISITTGKDVVQKGDLSFKSPSFLRIDFTSPPDQVIAFDGQSLTIYIPGYQAILLQSVADKPGAAATTLATREGLKMLRRSYSIAFESSPAPLPLDGAPGETAVRLALGRSSAAEGFTTLKLYITPDTKLIRRIEGWTISGDKLTFDFTAIKTNVGIPAARFVYDSPASANVYPNFLFNSTN